MFCWGPAHEQPAEQLLGVPWGGREEGVGARLCFLARNCGSHSICTEAHREHQPTLSSSSQQ